MKQLISENFVKRSVICNVLLMMLLSIPTILGFLGATTVPIMIWDDVCSNWASIPSVAYDSVLEINVIIALFAAYGFILKNKKVALFFGLTTLYSILIFILPFFTTESDPMEGITDRDYWYAFHGSFIVSLILCLIVFASST